MHQASWRTLIFRCSTICFCALNLLPPSPPLLQATEQEGAARATSRRPSRTTLSQRLRATGVAALLEEVCLRAEDFAANVEADDMANEPPEPSERPLEWAEAKLRSGVVQEVESAEHLLARLQDLMAEALAVEPVLRKGLRPLFWR